MYQECRAHHWTGRIDWQVAQWRVPNWHVPVEERTVTMDITALLYGNYGNHIWCPCCIGTPRTALGRPHIGTLEGSIHDGCLYFHLGFIPSTDLAHSREFVYNFKRRGICRVLDNLQRVEKSRPRWILQWIFYCRGCFCVGTWWHNVYTLPSLYFSPVKMVREATIIPSLR